MERILKAYLKRLTNLSTRNKSLLLTNLPGEQFIDLHSLDFLSGKPSIEVVRQLVQQKSRITLCDVADARYEKVNEASKRLRKIARTERFIQEERGSQDLFVGYPFVKGKLSDGTPIHAPLLFFPVTLRMDREQWCLFEREEGNVALNQSFALAYAQFNETQIADEVLEKSFEDFPEDLLSFKTALYEWLKTTPFKINFNQDLFEEKLIAFSGEKAADLHQNEKNGELKLYPEAILGIFPQAGSYLVPDYNRLIEDYRASPFTIPLITPGLDNNADFQSDLPENTPVKLREEDVLTPFPVDESQEEVILNVKGGRSVVVQGPPGSGKSQLICNLMSDFASQGKRVLVVCQKRAALDVVYQRLQTIGMTDFVALIHDYKNDRPELYRQIASQIEKVEEYRKQNYSLDSVFLERQFTQQSRAIDKTVEELEAFRNALFDEKECGVSIKELYLTSDPTAPQVDLREHYTHFRLDAPENFRRKLGTYARYKSYFPPEHPWAVRRDFSTFGIGELRSIEQMLSEWPEVFQKQKSQFESLSSQAFSEVFILNRKEAAERLADIAQLLNNADSWELFRDYLTQSGSPAERLAFIRQTTDALEGFLNEEGIEFSLPEQRLADFVQLLKKGVQAKESAVSAVWWNLFSKEKKEIEQVAQANGLTLSLEDLQQLATRIRNRQELESWIKNPSISFGKVFSKNENRLGGDEYIRFFRNAEAAADAVQRAAKEPWFAVVKTLARGISQEDFTIRIKHLITWLEKWDKLETVMLPYLLPVQINALLRDPERAAATLLSSLRRDFDSLVEMDRLWQEMSPPEQAVTNLVIDEAQKSSLTKHEDVVGLFDNSVKLAWIEHIETKYPHLRAVTSLKMGDWESSLQENIRNRQKLSADIAAIKLREATYEDVEKNRLGNRVTYRELGHQVTKKRKIWPIRKLLEAYEEEVFSLVPCWMASPESVSAIFPMRAELFDLVIFDEASQCYAEYGLPAAFRGKQIVVAGDSKQLSPSDLYRVRFEDRGEEEQYEAATDIESLLGLAEQSLDSYQLTGHYRSKSLDLIDFSNRYFYKNTLRLLPDFESINATRGAIHYVKTDGIWKDNINVTEAEKVVEILQSLQNTGNTVGVVTFNFFQQQAIADLLEKEAVVIPDLFVKNIENVQGDERDIILFSMGYAPDEKGKVLMQFGSLNMPGGENRLNVAVTRARERIYFVTSLWPSQLQTAHTANAGPKMLQAYLEYAFEVSNGNFKPVPGSTTSFRTDWLLKNKLLNKNMHYEKELPFGDVTIKEEGAYKGLILTDDDLYHQSKSSKEPHAYLPLLLELKNWPFIRVYSREYWTNSLQSKLLL